MSLLNSSDRRFLEVLSNLSYCNQFLPERVELERQVLGSEFDDSDSVWSRHDDLDGDRKNVQHLNRRAKSLLNSLREKLTDGTGANDNELLLYQDLTQYVLYYRYRDQFKALVDNPPSDSNHRVSFWKQFLDDFNHYLVLPDQSVTGTHDPEHWFADFFQVRRAFHHIYQFIIGRSMPTAQLRAGVWQSIFTHDLRRYRRALYDRMGDFTTLITGPSGTGKELVARAVGLSRYIPFDAEKQQFEGSFINSFHAVNLSALSPTLIESELFGHCRGAYTGAVGDRQGWLETCTRLGTVFLDEVGELDGTIQVKLLRVLQARTFQRLGETDERQFTGKIIAATNRDLALEMKARRFREDFYYRLCSDIITTPSLREQLADTPEDLHNLVIFIATRLAGDEAASVTAEVECWIEENLGADYAWPGNIRELEQCVRNVVIRKQYIPPPGEMANEVDDPKQRLFTSIQTGRLTAEELLQQYCTIVYAQLGSYEQTAKRLGIDRRTVKSKIDPNLFNQLTSDSDAQ